MLTFQKLDVYQCAIELTALVCRMTTDVPRGHAPLLDQLRRAAGSIALNIAEGVGRTSATDSGRCYAIARGSAMECVAAIDVGRALGIFDVERHRVASELLERIVAMLTKLCRL